MQHNHNVDHVPTDHDMSTRFNKYIYQHRNKVSSLDNQPARVLKGMPKLYWITLIIQPSFKKCILNHRPYYEEHFLQASFGQIMSCQLPYRLVE